MTDKNITLDKIVKRICVPVLLTYDSDAVGSATAVTDAFIAAFSQELVPIYDVFVGKLPTIPVRVHLCLFPLGSKTALRDSFHQVLSACQMLN